MQIPRHPGRVLVEDILEPLGVTQTAFASHLGWTFARLNEITNARRGITPDSALSLAEAIPGTTPEFWMDLQRDWDLSLARTSHATATPFPFDPEKRATDFIQSVVAHWTGPDTRKD
ncbi:HigA protein (antitoxin to HigB) [Leptospirillum ferriphilum]|jgi:addiction module HigA family antidote|uniref:Addiction module antidote protein, HigA family n=3 Tax=Leptospirillum TaxID=179 RepID=A0A094X215_9BACT|nr:HigA family addiction module antitoxin [Leptospirillum ferriphilum]AFS53932.1 plasmid maintenance system antidote protein, XRE family [Leptospirillum ferriphilum ML-04]EDZ38276.1 MAG: Plasmid maintenance system antidote protein, XRE family [Leptospirillum sp. Group II '5-way CG']KGA92574.1 HigA protein (antitoxin to HigB) [Leptospirillum ferriphilum]OOH73600.1 addiction module antidote protein, HigA family [Leptospirillum ferriphilum]